MKERVRRLFGQAGMWIVFAALLLALTLFVPNFASARNVPGLLMSVTTVGIVACTMLFCLAAGDFDLSVGSTVALSGVLAALLLKAGHPLAAALIVPLLVGACIGAANGFIIAKLGINALITTLATMQIVRGAARILSDGSSIGIVHESFNALAKGKLPLGPELAIPGPVLMMAACFVVFGLLLDRTVYGRNTLAIGGNAEAARLAGIHVVRTKILIFMVQGIIAAFAGLLVAARATSGQPNTAEGLELQVISGCVLGGVSLTGGVGSIGGVIVGVLIMGTVQNAMNLLNIPTFWQSVASGAILLAAVLLDRLKNRRT
jgi:L-arabinose transport system permease protein